MMVKKLDKILVVDVEATCWQGAPPEGQDHEIIEVGICVLDVGTGEVVPGSKRSILVKPIKSKVSEYCTRLTSLTQEQIDAGIPLAEACEILKREYLSEQRVWASWGDYDRKQFWRECRLKNIAYPFGDSHINVKNLFALSQGLSEELDLELAIEKLNLKFEGREHRAHDDAFNIARVLSILFLKIRK